MPEGLKKKRAGGAARKPGSPITDHGSRARARLGLSTDWDFILHLPLRYIDETRVTPIVDAQVGSEVQVEGDVVRSEVVFRGRRQLIATLRDDSGELLLRFLNFYPSQQKQLAPGRRVRALGTVRGGMLGLEIVHPLMRAADLDRPLPQRLTPVYPTTEGVAQTWLRKRIERALRDVDIAETVPAPLAERYRLLPLATVLRELHQPLPDADIAALIERRDVRWRRVGFDELLAQQLAMRIARKQRAVQTASPIVRGALTQRLLHALPFQLTGAQQRVGQEIEADLARGTPMHRLLQGDVGSGKTVIAALAAASAIDAGMQAALMAPTEILAEQHFRRIAAWLEPLGVRIAWLTGKLRAAEKRAAHAAIADGSAQLVIGTHALIQDAVRFARLGLAIVDEQHRFGVAQRLALRAAEGSERRVPHLLMLSATPIPRTLAMSYLADLDVSTIDELPPGRTPVLTKLVSTARRAEVLARVRDEVQQGRQAYWVCPLVEESDKLDAALELTAATTMFEQTRAELPELRWGLVHGQLPAAEKAAVMTLFAEGAIDVLVATTVIEVGVDVPRASLMVIEHAQRFGLAQLHQLRGRVGRGMQHSVCVLLYDEPLGDTARERLKVIYESTDGFEIARRDLQLRGPGEFLGARQSGLPLLRFADLERDAPLVEQARACAELMLRDHPEAARAHVARWLGGRAAMLDA
jgi:ATP-dependent DNA helicase RecG